MNLRPVFFSAAYRVMFFAGGVQTLLTMLLWSIDLGARYAGLYAPLRWPIPAPWLHAFLMLYGVFSYFIFGFLMTALPKWVARGPLVQAQYVPSFFLLVTGWCVFYAALVVSGSIALKFVIPLAIVIVALGWGVSVFALFTTVRESMNTHKIHAWIVLCALVAGLIGILLFTLGLVMQEAGWVHAAIQIGLWLYLVPIFFTVTYRMLPFFSASVVRGYVEYRSSLPFWCILVACVIHALVSIVDGNSGPWWFIDLGAALLLFWLTWRWQIHKVFVSHLLTMHHLAGLWLAMAFLMFAVQGAAPLMGLEVGWGGRAPLHALTVGYFGSILLSMVTRVSLGHSGRLISSDTLSWRLFWAYQLVAVLRIIGEWHSGVGIGNPVWLSALVWLLIFGAWAALYLKMFLTPRPDGRPG